MIVRYGSIFESLSAPLTCMAFSWWLLQVARLYRDSLKTLLSWVVDRDIFNEKATELRARFDANRGVNPSAASRLLRVS